MSGFRPMTFVVFALALLLAGCDGSGSSGGPGGSGGEVPGPNVQLSGRVTYDFVPTVASLAPREAYLDYASTVARPARGVQVAAIAEDGGELATGTADADGRYVLTVPKNANIRLRAIARLFKAPGDGASWDFTIRDNTSPGYADKAASIYAVQGEAFSTGVAHLSRDLHAASGWTGAGYGNPRSAAPFAILDQIFSAMQKVLAVDEDAVFAPMNTYWSVDNRPGGGDKAKGEIGTSHWQAATDHPGLYILGKEDVDTDEYDTAVIVHEWGHYFESRLSRSDSLGGHHTSGEVLDMRLAFGEGWGNALAGMVRDDPIYADTMDLRQSVPGAVMNLDTIPAGEPRGWFNEASVQHVLYQMYRAPSIGFGRIYAVMVGPQKNTPAFTSLFSFATYLREAADGVSRGVIDFLLGEIYTVNGDKLDIWGTNQTYPTDPGSLPAGYEAIVLPIYTDLVVDGGAAVVCGTDDFGSTDNAKLGNYRYLRMKIPADGDYTLTFSGLGTESWAVLHLDGEYAGALRENSTSTDTWAAGVYAVWVRGAPLDGCRTITLTKK